MIMLHKMLMKEMTGFAICVAACCTNMVVMYVNNTNIWGAVLNLTVAIACGVSAYIEYRQMMNTADMLDNADAMDWQRQNAHDALLHQHSAKLDDLYEDEDFDDEEDGESIQDFLDKCNN